MKKVPTFKNLNTWLITKIFFVAVICIQGQLYSQSIRIQAELTQRDGIYYDGEIVFNGFIVSLNQGQPSTKYEIQAGKPKGVFTSYHFDSNFKKENYKDTAEIRKLEKFNEELSLKIKSLIDDTTKKRGELAAFIDTEIGGVKKLTKLLAKKSENKLGDKQQQLWEKYNSLLKSISNAKNELTTNYSKLTSNKKNLEKEINKLQFVPKIKEEYDYEGQNKTGDYIEYYENGKIKRQGMFNANLYNGSWVYYYENGNIKAEGKFINGNGQDVSETSGIPRNGRDGLWVFNYDTGHKNQESTFKTGKLEGLFKSFFENGNLESQVNYTNDNLTGIYREYYNSGKLKQEKNYKTGSLEGVFKSYSEVGQITMECTYVLGKKTGAQKEYHQNNVLKSTKNYVNGEIDGVAKEYFENGKIQKEYSTKNGYFIGAYKEYYSNGNLKKTAEGDASCSSCIKNIKKYNEDGSPWISYWYQIKDEYTGKEEIITYRDGLVSDRFYFSLKSLKNNYYWSVCSGKYWFEGYRSGWATWYLTINGIREEHFVMYDNPVVIQTETLERLKLASDITIKFINDPEYYKFKLDGMLEGMQWLNREK
jgi:antitoxin component YwqK of YwqJK toxin-antitoxin module